ncbi:MAG TPA: SAM-dependent methyltransferase, partial [Actinobacteria bacterium]|nr:SAM-dependent methyltransferase [Actinomycetota bacterium]
VAIDVSRTSLDHHRWLKEEYDLANLELHRLPIEDVSTLGGDFDLIVSSGVLHHLADPLVGMSALAEVLRPNGVIGIMLYAKYGRLGVEMLQGVFREMDLKQDQESVDRVREALAVLSMDHPVRSYLEIAPDLQFDAGLVDTFLHGRDRSYTVDECIALTEEAGLAFQDWLLKSPYYPHATGDTGFLAGVTALPERQQWSIMERINFRNGCHFFTACHPQRPKDTYVIDFSGDSFTRYVPEFRHECSLEGARLSRYDWSVDLNVDLLACAQQIDGERPVAEIVDMVNRRRKGAGPVALLSLDGARQAFRFLWELDFIAMGIRA